MGARLMSIWYCDYCDRIVDSNAQDHADYDRMMCENCVDKEKEDDTETE